MQTHKNSKDLEYTVIRECLSNEKICNTLKSFTMAEIVAYFIEVIAADKQPAKDFKSLRESSYQLFRGGHVQKVELKPGFETLIIKCTCLPEMRKDRVYNILVRVKENTADIQFAKCDCLAGKGPKATCKHIAALCYALEDFSRNILANEECLSCTDKLMQWNQPRKRRLEPKRISELDFSLEHHDAKKKKKKTTLLGRDPLELVGKATQSDIEAINAFVTKLQSFGARNPKQKPAFLSVINTTHRINRSATATLPLASSSKSTDPNLSDLGVTSNCTAVEPESVVKRRVLFKQNLNLNEQERNDLFEKTKTQSDCELWYRARAPRITGSMCGRIINRNKNIFPSSILKSLQTSSSLTTAAALMGKQQEPIILSRYLKHQRDNGNPDISIERAGFLVDKEKSFLGASPDAVVVDSEGTSIGCVEIKAAAGNWESSIDDIITTRKGNFCLCKADNSDRIVLKSNHIYYHQCQLQLYVGRDRFRWCDFVLATKDDLFIQRIMLDMNWVNNNVPELELFYDSFLIKRLVV